MRYTIIAGFVGLLLAACGGGGSSSSPVPVASSSSPVTKVSLSGKVTYDSIPHDPNSSGLNYTAIIDKPVKSVRVDLIDSSNRIVSTDVTNVTGEYSFVVDANTQFSLRVSSALSYDDGKSFMFSVRDNTAADSLYSFESPLQSSGQSASQTRNIHFASGWDGTSYSAERTAAPFAILDPIDLAVSKLREVDPEIEFAELNIFWSPNNRTVIGDKSLGHIGSTGYFKGETPAVYVLGEADRNTDEYDSHVILHEFAHYFEDNFSRFDSLGGLHDLGERLDPRVAFSEGFAHAFAAIILDDPVYKDSVGDGQNLGLSFDLETVSRGSLGWYNETSVASIIYDIYDTTQDSSDYIGVGFGPIIDTMRSDSFVNAEVFSTIYTFTDAMKGELLVNGNDLDLLLNAQSILGVDKFGDGERNNGGIASSLPIYKQLNESQTSVKVCSVVDAGNFNKLGNREFIHLSIPREGNYRLLMKSLPDQSGNDPDFIITQAGNNVGEAQSSKQDDELFEGAFTAGDFVIEAYNFFNINGVSSKRGDVCFDFSFAEI